MEKNNDGNIIIKHRKTEPAGENEVLTLDIRPQGTVEDLLAEYASRQERPVGEDGEPEPAKGLAAAVVDMTGGVLALASYPTYDPGRLPGELHPAPADESRPLHEPGHPGPVLPAPPSKCSPPSPPWTPGPSPPRAAGSAPASTPFYPPPTSPGAVWVRTGGTTSPRHQGLLQLLLLRRGAAAHHRNINEYARKFGLGELHRHRAGGEKGPEGGPETSKQLNPAVV